MEPATYALIAFIFFCSLIVIGQTGKIVSLLTQPDGTYQKCRIPAPNTSQGFYCDPIEREEYLPYVSNDLIDNPDGSQTWYVSHER